MGRELTGGSQRLGDSRGGGGGGTEQFFVDGMEVCAGKEQHADGMMFEVQRYRGSGDLAGQFRGNLHWNLKKLRQEAGAVLAADAPDVLGVEESRQLGCLLVQRAAGDCVDGDLAGFKEQQGRIADAEIRPESFGHSLEDFVGVATSDERFVDVRGEGQMPEVFQKAAMSLYHVVAQDVYLAGLNLSLPVYVVHQLFEPGMSCFVHPKSPKTGYYRFAE